MISILVSSSILLYLSFGFGLFFKKISKMSMNFSELLLLGLVIINTLVSFGSLFFPTNQYTFAVFVTLGTIFIVFLRKEVKQLFLLIVSNKLLLGLLLLFFIAALFKSSDYPENYDSSLYHLQAIKWIEKFPAIPGLANLHGRLGFNSNVFCLYAFSSLSFIFKQEVFSVNFTVFIIVAIYFINTLIKLASLNKISNLLLFNIVIFCAVIRMGSMASPTPDYIATVITLFVFIRIINLSFESTEFEITKTFPVFIIAVYVMTIKLAELPILILFVLLAFDYKNKRWRQIFKTALFGLLIIIPWCLRSVVLSGWLVYPFPHFELFNFDWKVPLSKVIAENQSITAWARGPNIDYKVVLKMGIQEWFPIWWHTLNKLIKMWLLFAVFFPVFGLIGILLKKINISRLNLLILVTAFLGVIYWFVLAPDIRFGAPFILICAWSFLLYFNFSFDIKPLKIMQYAYVLLLFIYFIYSSKKPLKKIVFGRFFGKHEFVLAPKMVVPQGIYFKLLPVKNGNVFVPSRGDRCFDCEIPCAPSYDQNIVFRGNKVNSGFKYNEVVVQKTAKKE